MPHRELLSSSHAPAWTHADGRDSMAITRWDRATPHRKQTEIQTPLSESVQIVPRRSAVHDQSRSATELKAMQEIVAEHKGLRDELDCMKQQIARLAPGRRSHEQKLLDAAQSPALVQIASGTFCTNASLSVAEAYIVEAESAEALALELRKMASDLEPDIGDNTLSSRPSTHELAANQFEVLQNDVEPGSPESSDLLEALVCCSYLFNSVSDLVEQCKADHASASVYTEYDRKPSTAITSCAKVDKPLFKQVTKDSHLTAIRTTGAVHGPVPTFSDVECDYSPSWRPSVIRKLPALKSSILISIPSLDRATTFTWEFLVSTLGGSQWTPGFYWIPPHQQTILPKRAYYILDAENESCLPPQPGSHGAKLTAFFNNTTDSRGNSPAPESYTDTPVFIAQPTTAPCQERQYLYYGTYTQSRFSDRLDHDRMTTYVSASVKHYWADQLASRQRPEWVTEALMSHFWPRPTYTGPLSAEDAAVPPSSVSPDASAGAAQNSVYNAERKFQKALDRYVRDLAEWERDARMKVSLVRKEDLLKAFEAADAAIEPGLRLWWEYLQCTGWDGGFYGMLIAAKEAEQTAEKENRRKNKTGLHSKGDRVAGKKQKNMELEAPQWGGEAHIDRAVQGQCRPDETWTGREAAAKNASKREGPVEGKAKEPGKVVKALDVQAVKPEGKNDANSWWDQAQSGEQHAENTVPAGKMNGRDGRRGDIWRRGKQRGRNSGLRGRQ